MNATQLAFIDVNSLGIGAFITIGLIVLAASIFWIVELIDAARREYSNPSMKIVWILVVLFGHFIGSVLYYAIGKQQGYLPGQVPRT